MISPHPRKRFPGFPWTLQSCADQGSQLSPWCICYMNLEPRNTIHPVYIQRKGTGSIPNRCFLYSNASSVANRVFGNRMNILVLKKRPRTAYSQRAFVSAALTRLRVLQRPPSSHGRARAKLKGSIHTTTSCSSAGRATQCLAVTDRTEDQTQQAPSS